MPFEARVYIQGVAVYVPNPEKPESEMLVLFPDQEKAAEKGIRDSTGNSICRHRAVVQLDSRCLSPSAPDAGPGIWTTIELSGMWLELTAEPSLAPRLTVNGRVPGVPFLPDILREQAPAPEGSTGPSLPALDLDPRARQDAPSAADLLRAGLFLNAGILSPYAEFEGLYSFPGSARYASPGTRKPGSCPNPDDHKLSSVLKLELGEVQSLTLHVRPFGAGSTASDLSLHPPSDPDGEPWDELEVWVRHFCELGRPDLEGKTAEPDAKDVDFTLNYTLLQHLDDVLKAFGNVLPVPSVSKSWGKGGLIGSAARKCMGAQVSLTAS